MLVMIFTMLVVLVLAAGVIAVVVMGMEGTGRDQHPEIADAMARTARHLNGEGEPPRALVAVFDEIDEVGDLDVRDLPAKLRQASTASAKSARTAWSALSSRSAPSANPPEPEDRPAEQFAEQLAEPDPEQQPERHAVDADPSPADPPIDDEAARVMTEALLAPVPDDPGAHDPYGVWGHGDPDGEPTDEGAAAPDERDRPQDRAADGESVVRVRLPEQDVRD